MFEFIKKKKRKPEKKLKVVKKECGEHNCEEDCLCEKLRKAYEFIEESQKQVTSLKEEELKHVRTGQQHKTSQT